MQTHSECLEKIKDLMKKHDWFFDCADDMREWRKGSSEKFEIMKLLREVPASRLPGLLKMVPTELRDKWAHELSVKNW